MRHLASALAVAAGLLGPAAPAATQILADLPPIRLDYRVYLDDAAEPAGETSVSFEAIDTARGRRLEVHGLTRYMVGDQQPVELLYEARFTCDALGVEKFDGRTRYGEEERRYVAVRSGIDYHLTEHRGDQTSQRTETAGVQRTNWGLFCGGFLAERLSEGELMQDYPMLFPASGRHFPRQKYRTARVTLQLPSGESFPIIETQLARPDVTDRDELWNKGDRHEILIRMEEEGPLGRVTHELAAVDGVPVDWALALRPQNSSPSSGDPAK